MPNLRGRHHTINVHMLHHTVNVHLKGNPRIKVNEPKSFLHELCGFKTHLFFCFKIKSTKRKQNLHFPQCKVIESVRAPPKLPLLSNLIPYLSCSITESLENKENKDCMFRVLSMVWCSVYVTVTV